MATVNSPQPLAVGEASQNTLETLPNTKPKQSSAGQFQRNKSAAVSSKIDLIPVNIVHGEPTVEFTIEEVNTFTIEEGLHQAVILKFSYGKPDIQEMRQIIPKQFDVKGYCNVGQLEFRHILVRFDLFDDFVQFLSRTTGIVKAKGEEFFFRTFPWTIGFNPREETSKAAVWISFPMLPPNFFAMKSVLSIASAVGKPLAVDKATQNRTRPSAARVKVLLDLKDKHPKRVKFILSTKVLGNMSSTIRRAGKILEEGLLEVNEVNQHQMLNLQTEGGQQAGTVNEGIVGIPNASVQMDTRNKARRDNGQLGDGKQIVTANRRVCTGTKTVNVEATLPDAQAESEQGFEQGTLSQGTGVGGKLIDASKIAGQQGNDELIKESAVVASKDTDTAKQCEGQQYQSKAIVVNVEGHDHAGVEALECEDATVSKVVNSAADVQANTGALKPTASLKYTSVVQGFEMWKLQDAGNQIRPNAGFDVVSAVENSGQNLQCPNLKYTATVNTTVDRDANTVLPTTYDAVGSSGISPIEPGQLQQRAALAEMSKFAKADNNQSAKSKHRAWTVVNHSHNSRNSNATKNMTAASLNTNISNSFDVLVEDQISAVMKDDEAVIKATHTNSSNSVEVQQTLKKSATGFVTASAAAIDHEQILTPGECVKGVGQATNPSNYATKSNDWTEVNPTPSKKQSPGLQNQFLSSKTIGVSNSFIALVNEHEQDAKEAGNTKQHIGDEARPITEKTSSSGSGVQQQTSKEIGARVHGSTEIVYFDDLNIQMPSEAIPTLQFSSQELANMIKESQESFGEQGGDSGQQLISTGNNQNVEKGMASLSQSNSINEKTSSMDQQGETSAIVVKRKTGAERAEEKEEQSATPPSKNEAAKVQGEQVSNSTESGPKRRGLSPNVPAFVPSKQQQTVAALEGVSSTIQADKEVEKSGQQRALSATVLSSMHNFDATRSSSAMATKYNLSSNPNTPAIVPTDVRKGATTSNAGQQQIVPSGQKQIVTTIQVMSEDERMFLDAILSSNSAKPINPTALVTNTKGQSALVALDFVQNAPQSGERLI
ncbi:uncharacterized protein [Nicotiana sylvestris]|uniref:uncharacterized protein n=1 Tax=Nicotiana sylvestris TaxID=4096 RepID=UPI00388C401E